MVPGVPIQLMPISWQVEQATEVTTLCTMAGAAVPLAFANMKELKLEFE